VHLVGFYYKNISKYIRNIKSLNVPNQL